MKQEQKIESNPILFLIQCIKKEKRVQYFVSFFTIILGGLFFYFSQGRNAALIIVSLILCVTGIKFFYDTLRSGEPQYYPIIKILSFHPIQIVWIYSILTENMPFGIKLFSKGRIVFKLENGEEYTISVPFKELKIVGEQLKKILPHASYGYSTEKMQWYIADPHLLYQENSKEDDKK